MDSILILHGWSLPTPGRQWVLVKEILESQGYRVFLPDLPGFGNTPQPSKPWTISDYAAWLNDFCEINYLWPVFLIGHSFGGSVASKFSVKYPEKVRKLILINSAGIRRKKLKKEIQKKIAHCLNKLSFLPFYGLVRKIAYRTLFRQSDYLLTEGVMKETYLNVIKEDISDIFSNIFVPTLLIWGEKDKITPLRDAYFMKEKIPGAKLEIIPGLKHNLHSEAPEELSKIILNFLRL